VVLPGECSLPSCKVTTRRNSKQLLRFVEDAVRRALLTATEARLQRVVESLVVAIDLFD
jgi:hypothetical protein